MPSEEQIREVFLSAAKTGNLNEIQDLLDQGVDVNLADTGGETALHWAAYAGNLDMVSLLLKKGAKVDLKNIDGWTALDAAALKGHVEVVSVLLEAGADGNQADSDRLTALQIAARKGHVEVVSVLLQAGADFNLLSEQQIRTAFIFAAKERNLNQIQDLLAQGVDVNLANLFDETALHVAAKNGDVGLCRVLLEASANVNLANIFDETALYIAAKNGDVGLCRVLLEAGADVNLTTKSGNTALQHAHKKGHIELVCLLCLYGAFDAKVSETPEMRAWRQLGACLREAQRDATDTVVVSKETRLNWEALHAANPGLYLVLARFSPKLHGQETAYFGAYPDVYWGRKFGLFSPRPVGFFAQLWHFTSLAAKNLVVWFVGFFRQQPEIDPIRKQALRSFQREGKSFSNGAELSQAVEHYLSKKYPISQGDWNLPNSVIVDLTVARESQLKVPDYGCGDSRSCTVEYRSRTLPLPVAPLPEVLLSAESLETTTPVFRPLYNSKQDAGATLPLQWQESKSLKLSV